ncbi:hypothetical protein EIKCOROL_00372 [Eikenella corrodens ATCC 23834]|uniref:Uncharacterized protein n=1 Tax=Eikenella corrodens ATCC 23834 TaxID=546274 RepID=C0DSQ0_EIKCO|nr:hypothetical protein EIKCOROL_00372 [Eikenella corrodens ATCC 23834]
MAGWCFVVRGKGYCNRQAWDRLPESVSFNAVKANEVSFCEAKAQLKNAAGGFQV